MNHRRRLVAATTVIAAAACAEPGPSPGTDAAGQSDAGSGPWLESTVIHSEGGVVVEQVSYQSSGLVVRGQVCRPTDPARVPVLVLNHGGFSGIEEPGGGLCLAAAQNGYLVLESSYRGEDGSEGEIEVCAGEVDDVLAMLEAGLRLPQADSDRVLMLGFSHGGCITVRAVQRGAPVRAAAAGVPVLDPAEAFAFWNAQLAGDPPAELRQAYELLVSRFVESLGGTPEQVPEAYAERSALAHADGPLADLPPMLIVQGTADALVPYGAGCRLAEQTGIHAYHVTSDGTVVASPPPGCEGLDIDWGSGSVAGAWPDRHYIGTYAGAGHDFSGPTGPMMLDHLLAFVAAHTQ